MKRLGLRRKSVAQVAKITNTMKLVASIKLRQVTAAAEAATPFTRGVEAQIEKAGCPEKNPDHPYKYLYVAVTTDKGLCGPINANLIRKIRALDLTDVRIATFGEKGASNFGSAVEMAPLVAFSGHSLGRHTPSFTEISNFVDRVFQEEWDVCRVYFTEYLSTAVFKPAHVDIPHQKLMFKERAKFSNFISPIGYSRTMEYYAQFFLAAVMNKAVYQTAAAEMASRQSSMDSATKNAEDLLKRLKVEFNKVRQNVITTELVEINSGAAVIQKAKQAD